ncbi:hypothetical protein DM860_016951 [Cuscuta australis]|uniref:Uncharacterized protein n=1 Tax=Cuscuta australis TaxID=267555 RepID=A0A328DXM1_9ASTE|nr:hypothetical protein DM860_016951 [Cuscuta australis]
MRKTHPVLSFRGMCGIDACTKAGVNDKHLTAHRNHTEPTKTQREPRSNPRNRLQSRFNKSDLNAVANLSSNKHRSRSRAREVFGRIRVSRERNGSGRVLWGGGGRKTKEEDEEDEGRGKMEKFGAWVGREVLKSSEISFPPWKFDTANFFWFRAKGFCWWFDDNRYGKNLEFSLGEEGVIT